eukprot:11314786-Karenia_brevis.AAC.1
MALGFNGRASMLQGAVLPRGLFTSSVNFLPKRLTAHLRSAVLRALWGPGRKLRCSEVVSTLFCRGHRLDPDQIV